MIKKLIKLADQLDFHGFKKAADVVDLISKICIAENEDVEEETLRDMERLMEGWDTEKAPEFPQLRNDSPYPRSQFPLDKADIWYTYAISDPYSPPHVNRLQPLPDEIKTQHRIESYFKDGLSSLPNMAALIAFPEGIDLLIEFESGDFPMASRGHDEAGQFIRYEDVIGEINGSDIRKYGTLVTNADFIHYAKQHKFSAPGHIE